MSKPTLGEMLVSAYGKVGADASSMNAAEIESDNALLFTLLLGLPFIALVAGAARLWLRLRK